ncbi:hypothetical protein BOTBODRAFT_30252 [Botryobasidium botryosum FD-172 SS1]|uniref:Uncharacterized protein n=1 Tax=Botryobasidium botryosum (strain FD-172 SS1) TaxID=930990 RepID=A0A067MQB5_BOTB1|nr:hypothetical protein BOTBODRAFT_30252 [Botryobasidium botryosum FD-172 SS1]
MPLPFQNHSQTGSDVDIDNSTLPPDAGEIIKMLEESNCTSANWATVVAEYYAKGWLGTAEIVCQAGLEFVKQDENVKLLTVLFEKIKASQAEKGTGTQATQPTEINCLTEAVDLAAEGQIGNNSLEELQRKFPVDEGDANSSGDTLSDIRPLETLLSVTTQEAASPVQLEDGEVVDPELAKLRLLYQVAKSMVAAERAAKRKVEDEISAQRATIRKIEDVLFETEKEKVRREASMKQDRLAREKAERELDEMRRERDVLKRKNRDVEDELRATIKSKSKKSRFQTRHEHPASTT